MPLFEEQGKLPAPPIHQPIVQSIDSVINGEEAYGMSYQNLSYFLAGPRETRQSNYKAAELIFYGMNDLERFHEGVRDGLPHEIYSAMTNAEIAALFIGDGRFKYSNSNVSHFSSLSVEDKVSILVGIGFGYSPIREMQGKIRKSAPQLTEKESLKARIGALPYEVKRKLDAQLIRHHAVSSRDTSGPSDFVDTNRERSISRASAQTYLHMVEPHMKRVYHTR